MIIRSLFALVSIAVTTLPAQLVPPNSTGDAIGHIHLNVRDIEAQQRFWTVQTASRKKTASSLKA